MKKTLSVLTLLLFTFVSCDLAEIISGKKDNKDKNTPVVPEESGSTQEETSPNSCKVILYMGDNPNEVFMRKFAVCVYTPNQEISQVDCNSIGDNIVNANYPEIQGNEYYTELSAQNDCPVDFNFANQADTKYQSTCTYGNGMKIYSYRSDSIDENTSDTVTQQLCEGGGSGEYNTGATGSHDSTNGT